VGLHVVPELEANRSTGRARHAHSRIYRKRIRRDRPRVVAVAPPLQKSGRVAVAFMSTLPNTRLESMLHYIKSKPNIETCTRMPLLPMRQ
jgi:hypothetical protein